MKTNNAVKVVKIEFNDKKYLEEDVKYVAKQASDVISEASKDLKKKVKSTKSFQQDCKFVTQAKASLIHLEKLKRTFVIINHTRRLIVQELKRYPEITREALKDSIIKSISGISEDGRVPHILLDIVHRDIFHLHNRFINEGSIEYTETTSMSFKDEKFVNNRFTLNYRRDVLLFEDIGVTLYLSKPLPEVEEGTTFFLNVFVDSIANTKKIHVNLFFTVKNKRR